MTAISQTSSAATDTGPSHVTVTATWTTDASPSVGVDVAPASSGCPATDASPVAVTGSSSGSAAVTIPAPGTYVACGYFDNTYAGLASDAFTADWSFGIGNLVSGQYTDDAPVDITPQVSAYPSTGLWMYAHPGTGACGATASEDAARTGAIDAFLKPDQAHRVVTGPGIDQPTGRFTPADPGTYTICAYLSDSQSATPRATKSQQITIYPASATIIYTPPTDPTATRPATMGFDVTAKVTTGRSFFAYVHPAASGLCGINPAQEAARAGVVTLAGDGGVPMPDVTPPTVSKIHRDLVFTPPAPGRYFVCAYVAAGATGQVDGFSSPMLDARATAFPLAITATPATGLAIGAPVALHVTGSAELPRTLYTYVHAGGADACAATAAAEAARAADGGYAIFDPYPTTGALDATANETMGSDLRGYRACAYWAASPAATPDAIASATFLPPGADTGDLDVDPGPMPSTFGRRGKGSVYVNTLVLPVGVSAGRFLTLARRAAHEWGFTIRGTTKAGAAHRDGKRVVGFSRAMTTSRVAGLVGYRARVRTCTTRNGRRTCRRSLRTVETDIALSRDLKSWNPGPAHPTADQVDLETALVRAFGQLAGNRADAAKCSGSPLLGPGISRKGAWWRSATDHYQPGC